MYILLYIQLSSCWCVTYNTDDEVYTLVPSRLPWLSSERRVADDAAAPAPATAVVAYLLSNADAAVASTTALRASRVSCKAFFLSVFMRSILSLRTYTLDRSFALSFSRARAPRSFCLLFFTLLVRRRLRAITASATKREKEGEKGIERIVIAGETLWSEVPPTRARLPREVSTSSAAGILWRKHQRAYR